MLNWKWHARVAASAALGLLWAGAAACQERHSPVTVSASGPEVVGDRRVNISDLLSLRDLGGYSDGVLLSPDRSAVAFQLRQMDVQTNRWRTSWWVLPVSGGPPSQVGDGGDLNVAVTEGGFTVGVPATPVARWSPDGQWLAYVRKDDGEAQIWRSRRDGLVDEQLTHGDADIDSFVWAADGSLILFTLKALRRDQRLAERTAHEDGFLWDEEFYPLFGWKPRLPRAGDGTVWAVDTKNREERKATDAEVLAFKARSEPLKLAARPNARVVVTLTNSSRSASLEALDPNLQGYRAPLTVVVSRASDGVSPTVCGASACTGQIQWIGWHPSGDRLYFLRREGHGDSRRVIYEWRIGSRATRRIYATDDWIGDDCAIVKDRAICLYEAPTQPRRIVSIDLTTGTQTTLFDPNPEFRALQFTRIEKLEWQDRYGNDTFGHLVYPSDYRPGQQYPVVIVQYRSQGFLRGGIGGEYPIHVLAAQGFFVMSWDRPDFRSVAARLLADEAQTYAYAQNREHLSKQSALEYLLDSLTARGLVDPNRVGITGLSDGAETTFIGLIHSTRFAVAAVSSPPSDPVNYYFQSARYREIYFRLLGQRPPTDAKESRTYWEYLSFALNVDKVQAPILMNLPDSEASRATQGVAALRDAGKPFEAHIYPGEAHIKNQPKALLSILQRNVDWFNFWLREVEDPAPEKTEQYARWRKLRALKGSSNPERTEPRTQLLH